MLYAHYLGILEVVPGHRVSVMSLLPQVKSTLLAGVPPAAPSRKGSGQKTGIIVARKTYRHCPGTHRH